MTSDDRAFRVALSYHPIIHVPNLDEAEDFYARVFGSPSTNLSTVMTTPPAPGHATDYSTFTLIGDVLIDSLEPARYVTAAGQRYSNVESARVDTTGWYISGLKAAYPAMRAAGLRLVNARDEILDAEEWGGGPSPFYALPEDAGLRYQFFELFPFPLDPRVDENWVVPAAGGPLGISHASHHTILTTQPERALRLTVDVLGGEVIHEGRDDARGASGPYVRVADAVFHYARPDAGTVALADLQSASPLDHYHAITWKVEDLDQVAQHLEATHVAIAARGATSIITDPATSLGVPWGFTTESIPGDAR